MSDLFKVNGEAFIKALQENKVVANTNLSLIDLFETYVDLTHENANAVDKDMLRSLIFKQFKKYGDFDAQVRQTARTVSDITTTTGDVINAINNDNKEDMQTAFDKLKVHNDRICKLEDGLYLDEHTALYNRQYLFSQILTEDLKFKDNGMLFYLQIDDIDTLDAQYGAIIVKRIIKKFAQESKKALHKLDTPLIHYEDNEFILLTNDKDAHDTRNRLKILKKTFEIKKFKITGDKTLSFNFVYHEIAVEKNQLFDGMYSKVQELSFD